MRSSRHSTKMIFGLKTELVCFLLFFCIFANIPEDPNTFVKVSEYKATQNLDTIVVINNDATISSTTSLKFPGLQEQLTKFQQVDASFLKVASIHLATGVKAAGNPNILRWVFSPTISLDSDVMDSRNIYDAAQQGLKLATAAGAQNIVLVLGEFKHGPVGEAWFKPKDRILTAILGALYALYVPLEIRECCPEKASKYQNLYIDIEEPGFLTIINHAKAIEEGRWIARDICGSDPERMSTSKILEYLKNPVYFPSMSTFEEIEINAVNYPLLNAVNRASKDIPRHNGRVVRMTLLADPSKRKETLYLIGKGVTFDTGGLDLRVSGAMVGMHREKCGAAAVVGFMKTASYFPERHFDVIAKIPFVRNNIGPEAYSLDEIMKARSGKRIRIGDAAASGRMVLPDLITETIEEGAMQNGPTQKAGLLKVIKSSGEKIADMLEISTLRKEDFDENTHVLETEDLVQCSKNCISSSTPRGHQIPAAFLIQASGLDEHGLDKQPSEQIKFIHMDVSGSAGLIDTIPTASPMTMLARHYLLPD